MSAVTIHLIARDNRDLARRPTPFEEQAKMCPFCGHSNITVREPDDNLSEPVEYRLYWCHCMRCHCDGPASWDRRNAISKWNGRDP